MDPPHEHPASATFWSRIVPSRGRVSAVTDLPPAITIAPVAARRLANRLIAASSLVPNEPVLDMRDFAWTAGLRAQWRAIAGEADGAAWLWRAGAATPGAASRCPATVRALASVPGLADARFATLAAHSHSPASAGATKRLITCQLGLAVPRDGDVRMRIADRIVRWAEGETLVFDDSHEHEMWNDSGADRVVLTLRFARPLRNPGKWLIGRLAA